VVPCSGSDLMASYGREPQRHLVQHQQSRIGHESPADRQRLLLPTRERTGLPFPQSCKEREKVIDAISGPVAIAPGIRPDKQILVHRQAGKDAATFGHKADPEADALVSGHMIYGLSRETQFSGRGAHQPRDGLEQRGLPGSVGADDTVGLALVDVEGNAEESLEIAIVRDQIVYL
jgi:hypothetical protein